MSRRNRDAPPLAPRLATLSPDPTLLALLGDAILLTDAPQHADILLWTPETAASTPMPIDPLNVLDLRAERPGHQPYPAANLLLVASETEAGAWATIMPTVPAAILSPPLTPAPTPTDEFRALRILLDAPSPLAETALAWAKSRAIPAGILAPSTPKGLALTAQLGPAPALAASVVTLDLRTDPFAPRTPLLEALALGAPLLFQHETPFHARLEQGGAATRLTDAAALDTLSAPQRRALSTAALAYVRTHHDPATIAASLRRTVLARLATHRQDLASWPGRGPRPHVLVISDEALNLIDIRVHRPFAALLSRGVIAGYSLLRHRDFVFSTTPITPDLRFGAIWVQRSSDPLTHLLLRSLAKPFVYDLDDLLTVSPAYREPFPPEATATVRALAQDCAVLSTATPRLAKSLALTLKTVVTPNLAIAAPASIHGPAHTLVWASSDKPALTAARAEIERAVRDFCQAHRLKLLCIGPQPPEIFADLDVEHLGLLSHAAYMDRLRQAAPGILVGPLDTGADPDTQAFIDAKSDIKIIEARTAGLIGVFSRAAPYLETDLAPPILCDNDYRSWLAALERARQACEIPADLGPFPGRRTADGIGPLPWAEALRRAPTDIPAADIAAAIAVLRAQAETLLTTPDLFDEADYLDRHEDVRAAVADGAMPSGYRHFLQSGFREGRAARRLPTPHDDAHQWWTRLLRTLARLESETPARDAEIENLRDRLALRRAHPAPTEPAPAPHPATAEIPGPCPVCDAPGPHPVLMTVLDHPLGQCRQCRSCFYEDRTPYLYENEAEAALLLKLYLEQNAGIHQQTALLFALDDVDSVLDIGCGFGFTVDLATQLGWRAVGMDPSAMGEAGRRTLGVDIRNTYLDERVDEQFRLVIASEVIEHIPDPYPFLARLRAALDPSGTLILTTPDAGVLEPSIGDARTLCITAPRVHLVLFTRESLTLALQRVGFRHVQVTARNDSLLAFASDRDLRFRPDADQAHLAAYRAYLESLLDRAAPGSPLWNGAAGRLFALLTPSADLESLHALFARIAEAWRSSFDIDLARLRLPPLLAEADRRTTPAADLAATQPLNLPGVLLNRARLAARTPGRTPDQILAFARPAYRHALQTGRILQAANMIDHDLRQTAIDARMLVLDALAELAPELEPELLQALAEPSPGASAEWLDPTQAALVARLAPAFAAAVAADRPDDAARLEPWLHDLDRLTASLADRPELLFRTLFTLGRHRLDQDPAAALQTFHRMAAEARRRIDRPGRPSPAQDFLRLAKEHIALAQQRLETR